MTINIHTFRERWAYINIYTHRYTHRDTDRHTFMHTNMYAYTDI